MNEYILFDMDGTLLEFGEREFELAYMSRVESFLERRLPDKSKAIVAGIGKAVAAMRNNHTVYSNETRFWQCVEASSGLQQTELEPLFRSYYAGDYIQIGQGYQANPVMIEIVETLAAKGYQLVVATNPMLPQIANEYKLQWCRLGHMKWREITGFENYSRCKPNPQYYQQICNRLKIAPQQCTMIGNSLTDDLPAVQIGMEFYFLLDEHDNQQSNYAGLKGTRKDLLQVVKELPTCKAL